MTSAFDNAQILDSGVVASGFTVPQTVEPVWEGGLQLLSEPRSLSECKWRNVLPCDKGCISKARKSVKEQWRWHYTLSYQTRLFKSHIAESSLLVYRIFCQLPDRPRLQLQILTFGSVFERVLRTKSDYFFSFLNGLCGIVYIAVCVNRDGWSGSSAFSVDLLLQTLLWPLLLGLYGSAAAAIFGGSGRLWSHLCTRCRLTVLALLVTPAFFLFFLLARATQTCFPGHICMCRFVRLLAKKLRILVEACFCPGCWANTGRKEQRSSYGVVSMVP